MTSGRSNLVDVDGEIRRRTDKAILFYDGSKEVWLPLSQVEVNDDGTVTMELWLAMDKGLC